MTQPQPKRLTVRELLKLVDQLSPQEHEEFVEEMKLKGLCKDLQKGEDDLDQGRSLPARQVIAELKERNRAFREKGSV